MKKILIANRGEIARRVIRTCKKMGIQTVAVYSEADHAAPFVLEADEAYCIGKATSSESYLKQDKILEVALQTQTEGIHPGYGFLSENAEFAEKVTKAGIQFIGPSPYSMHLMGDKLSAKKAVMGFNVPLVPGTEYALLDPEEGKKIADSIGYPVLIKASAGGGGKGMRLVENASEFIEKMHLAQSEALASFGDNAVFIEKFVEKPRHIEIQVFADRKGNAVYLFERECSIQRRHQKVVEEAPSAILTEELRQKMGESAVAVVQAAQYEGAGTVEFLLDAHMNYYFLEMNTRLQVEHPVTELITGLDLVEWQIRIARGEELPLRQEQLAIHGHAIELRVCAEDAENDFLPNVGVLYRYRPPHGEHIRYDHGFSEGMEVPLFYDSMLGKLCVWAETREKAIERMRAAIDDFELSGLVSTLNFGKYVMQHPAFTSGHFDTNFIKEHYSNEQLIASQSEEKKALGYALDTLFEQVVQQKNATCKSVPVA